MIVHCMNLINMFSFIMPCSSFMFATLRYLVEIFFDMFFSWLSVLIFFSLISKSANDHQNLFFQTQNWSIFSLNTDLIFFFPNTKLICIFLNTDLNFFQTQNRSVFSLNIDLDFFSNKKLIYIFLRYRCEFFFKHKTDLYFP